MATSPALTLQTWSGAEREAVVLVPYALGALLLAGQAAVHVQQYVSLFHEVRWIGPLFIADAVASLVVIAALTICRWRRLAALAGIAIRGVCSRQSRRELWARAVRLAGNGLSHSDRAGRDLRGRRGRLPRDCPRRQRRLGASPSPGVALNGASSICRRYRTDGRRAVSELRDT